MNEEWVIDQVVRELAGVRYDDLIKANNHGEDGPDTYCWAEEACPP